MRSWSLIHGDGRNFYHRPTLQESTELNSTSKPLFLFLRFGCIWYVFLQYIKICIKPNFVLRIDKAKSYCAEFDASFPLPKSARDKKTISKIQEKLFKLKRVLCLLIDLEVIRALLSASANQRRELMKNVSLIGNRW